MMNACCAVMQCAKHADCCCPSHPAMAGCLDEPARRRPRVRKIRSSRSSHHPCTAAHLHAAHGVDTLQIDTLRRHKRGMGERSACKPMRTRHPYRPKRHVASRHAHVRVAAARGLRLAETWVAGRPCSYPTFLPPSFSAALMSAMVASCVHQHARYPRVRDIVGAQFCRVGSRLRAAHCGCISAPQLAVPLPCRYR